MTTEQLLRDWRLGAIQAERLCAGLLEINGYSDVDPQATLGGPDGKKDITARHDGKWFVAAVFFPPTTQAFHQIRAKFVRDREGVAINRASAFVFFVNQYLNPEQRTTLAELGGPHDEIFHLERIRHCLDSPGGYGLRQEYLGRSMSPEEQAALESSRPSPPPDSQQQHPNTGREVPVAAFPELGDVVMQLPEVYDGRPELNVSNGGIGQLELILYRLLRIDEREDLRLDAEANEALVPVEHRWWTGREPHALAASEDPGVASELLATMATLGGVPVVDLPRSTNTTFSALLEVDFWRHSPQWVLSSWFPGEATPYLAVVSASLAAWASDSDSGLLLYVEGTVVDDEQGIRDAPGPLHSYLLCVTRVRSGTDEIASVHRLMLSCPGEGWCRVSGCSTVATDIENELTPVLARAARSAGVASASNRHDAGAVYQKRYGSSGDGVPDNLIETISWQLQDSGWEELERSEWEGGNEELLLRRSDDFLVVEYDPVTRQVLLRDGTYALNGMLDLLADAGLITESGKELIADTGTASEDWSASCLSAAADVLAGRVDIERDPTFAPRQATMLGLHPAGLGLVTTKETDAFCEAQVAALLRSIHTELPLRASGVDDPLAGAPGLSSGHSAVPMRLAPLLPLTKLSREPVAGGELSKLVAEIEAARESERPPALSPPEFYQVDDRLIEVWSLSPGPVVIEFKQVEVPGARAALKEKLRDLVDLGLDVDALPPWQVDERSEVSRVFAGYLTAEEARADGRRLLLEAALRSPELRFMTGWDLDAVLLVRGLDWYTMRTRVDGSISYAVNEEPLNAHMTYAEMGGQLARDLEYDSRFGADLGSFARQVASAYVHREAADALLAQARQSMRVTLEGMERVAQAGGAPANLDELARQLFTDRSALQAFMSSNQSR